MAHSDGAGRNGTGQGAMEREAGAGLLRARFPARPLAVVLGGFSEAGRKARNDDAIAGRVPADPYELHARGVVACIADGVSTGRNSHKAAQLAVTQFTQDYYSAPESWPVRDCAARLLTSLNAFFHSQNRSGSPEAEGQVTTFTAMVLRSTTLHVVHVGDTRCHRLREGRLTALTADHAAPFLGGHEALTRALGVEPDVRVDYLQDEMREGDILALTSDGVHRSLSPEHLARALAAPAPTQAALEEIARGLCRDALAAGSDDNLSVLILRVAGLPAETPTETHRRLTAQAIPPALRPGNRIDGFEVVEVMHSSARSHVYRVRRAGDPRPLVLKAPSRNFAEDMTYLEGFTLEQWVGRRIDSPQVMKILPPEDSRFLYYVAEYIEGATLRDWMAAHPRPDIATVLPVLESLIAAVRVFHRMGMVHRDLKPENVILTGAGTAKIIDFGSVQVAGFRDGAAAGAVPEGSLNYMAPEVLAARGATNLSDAFSVAAIAYEMLTGAVPFDLEDRGGPPPPPRDWVLTPPCARRPDLPPALDACLARALAIDPAARPQAMSEFLGDLRRLARARPATAEFVPLLARGSLAFWRGWAMGATGVALALGAALLLGG